MNNYIILTDSSADLPLSIYNELDIQVLPLSFLLDGEVYHNTPDESSIAFKEVYAQLRSGKNVTTSAVNVETFKEAFLPYVQDGKDILYLGFSSGLSGTFSAGTIAAQELLEEYPERKIVCVDTLCASLGQGMLVYMTAKKRAEGFSLSEAAEYAEKIKLNVCHWFTVDDLFFLKRGGRISATTALVGSALGIKPILHVDNEGHLISVSKTRGRKKAITSLLEQMKASAIDPSTQIPMISHGDCVEDANVLADALRKEFGVKDVIINYVGPVIGAHSGPGTLALFFIGKER
ncbi:MAG: DegV family protein [Ruminococcaceae bacterium]|nr:DegV family protein [Oscillospiraceae bacterium]